MKVFLFASLFLSGLVAGLLYAYSCSVNPGLKALPDKEYIKAMQSINAAIQNPLFFISFIGLLLVFPLATYQLYKQQDLSFYLLGVATLIYLVAVFGVTIFFNVPLNEQLARFAESAASQDGIGAMRKTFEGPWNSYHTIRTIAAVVSFSFTILSVITKNSNQ